MIYYLNKHSSLKKIRGLLYYTTAILLTLAVPLAFNPSLSSMIFNNPEVLKIYSFNITLAEGLAIYIVPLAYIVLLYFFWQIRRVNLDLLLAFIGITFLIIVLLTPASPGWFIWCLPLLAQYQARKEAKAILWTSGFSILYILLVLINGQHVDLSLQGQINSPWLLSIIHTAMVSVGLILIINLYEELINKNVFFKFSKEPLVIGIAGDSGAGKDTLVNHIKDIFGYNSITHISGDDYHLWERKILK
jgi:hypothetical protein